MPLEESAPEGSKYYDMLVRVDLVLFQRIQYRMAAA